MVDRYSVLVEAHALIADVVVEKQKRSVTVDATKLALVVRIIEVCTFNISLLHRTVKYCMLGSKHKGYMTHNPIEIRKIFRTISILGYFDGIYTVTGFIHNKYINITINVTYVREFFTLKFELRPVDL